ncbi:MAG: hypothetical protein KBC72_00360 [Acinetobacter sp.]|nr:hypothetical protein [Acinetobacter sp.]
MTKVNATLHACAYLGIRHVLKNVDDFDLVDAPVDGIINDDGHFNLPMLVSDFGILPTEAEKIIKYLNKYFKVEK